MATYFIETWIEGSERDQVTGAWWEGKNLGSKDVMFTGTKAEAAEKADEMLADLWAACDGPGISREKKKKIITKQS